MYVLILDSIVWILVLIKPELIDVYVLILDSIDQILSWWTGLHLLLLERSDKELLSGNVLIERRAPGSAFVLWRVKAREINGN